MRSWWHPGQVWARLAAPAVTATAVAMAVAAVVAGATRAAAETVARAVVKVNVSRAKNCARVAAAMQAVEVVWAAASGWPNVRPRSQPARRMRRLAGMLSVALCRFPALRLRFRAL